MCDYSLHYVANRPAKVGDKLVTTRFPESITHGFAAEPNRAMAAELANPRVPLQGETISPVVG